ncbi:MAG: 5'/3'-nucleotidase SurE, partial [Verrucomicrobiota bacterium]
MNILLSNDDGIHARGIRVLRNALSDLGNQHVVAPHEEQSAVGHAITIFDPIRMTRVHEGDEFIGCAIHGTPADCVKVGLGEILKDEPPSIVFSGINLGPNTGVSVLYSGTVSAATEAAIHSVPSVAFSINTYVEPEWDTAGRIAREVAEKSLANPLPDRTLLNVNIPNLPYAALKGYAITRMARSRWIENFHKRTDPRKNEYFWLDG